MYLWSRLLQRYAVSNALFRGLYEVGGDELPQVAEGSYSNSLMWYEGRGVSACSLVFFDPVCGWFFDLTIGGWCALLASRSYE